MRRIFLAFTAIAAIFAMFAIPTTAEAAPRRYRGFVSTLNTPGYRALRTLHVYGSTGRALLVLEFADRGARGTRWRGCVNRTDGRPRCVTGITGTPGRPNGKSEFPILPGRYVARFRVGGRLVATWSFVVVR